MENIGEVNLNDQYKLNSSKSKRGTQNLHTVATSNITTTSGKHRSNSQGSNEK